MQRLMQAIAAQNSNIPPPDNSSMIHSQPSAQIAPYDQTYNDYNRYRNDLPVAAPPSQSSLPMLSAISNDAPPLEPLLHENNARLQKTYRDAVEIEADMDVLQHSLNSLIHDLGMDPQVLIAQAQERDPPTGNIPGALLSNSGHANGVHANGFRPNEMDSDALMLGVAANGHQEEAAPDLFLESLLNGMSPGTDGNMEYSDVTDHFNPSARIDGITVADASTEQLAAFLDEVSDTASPHMRSPEIKTTPAKRKSDVAGLAPSIVDVEKTAAAGPKSKRKR
ncbi:hypothetical protein WOLCODRAFT_114425 [Wolfiporia cocos MD-104 SS10]|uniref:Uncharacterized protein n=1 Tax=Wolfiporia cocos (strain MD-104) TaxID=742152 RepID=A0A2H3JPG2_WOLCO|nr:hypothetical protein WOLCODRAFT_114425 [Wolfiporia cocos MD-104 SS10]